MARPARAWASAIGAALGLPLALRDERLSSHRAEERLGPMPRGRSGGPPTPTQRERYRARVDREAAAIILQDEIEARRGGGSPRWVAPAAPVTAVSIRGGGEPRDQAQRMKPGAYDGAEMPAWRATDGRGGPPPGGSRHDQRGRGRCRAS